MRPGEHRLANGRWPSIPATPKILWRRRSERGKVSKIAFVVMGEPIPKARARVFFNKHLGRAMAYTPEKTASFELQVAWTAKKHRPAEGLITGPVKLTVRIFRSIPKSFSGKRRALAEEGKILPITKPDASNVVKSVEDALNKILWVDDSQVCDHTISKRYSSTPRVEVEIELMEVGNGN